MRVAILSRGDLFPTNHGAAVKIVRTAEALSRGGDRVSVVSEDRDAYWRLHGGEWTKIPYGPRFRAMEEWPALRQDRLVEALLRAVGYPEEEWLLYRPLFDASWYARAAYVGLRERVEVYQAEFPGFLAPALFAGRLLGGKVMLGAHNVEVDRLRQMTGLEEEKLQRIGRVEGVLGRAADRVMAVSMVDRRRFEAVGVAPEKVSVVPIGVDAEAYDGRKLDLHTLYDLAPGPILFFHGTLHYAPNAEAVRFLAEIVEDLPGTILVAGMSPPLHLSTPKLRFLGPIEDLPGHIQAADLCLCPLWSGGGTRMKILEYFAAGKAVVSTPFGAEGLEVAQGREILFAEREDFVATVREALGDAPLRGRLGQAARRFALSRSWASVASSIQAIHRGGSADYVAATPIDGHLPARIPSKPLTLLFLVNRGCNLRCSFCDLWDRPERVALSQALSLFEEAVAIGTRTVVLTGGEPLLHPDLPAMIAGAKRRGLSVNLTTNGTFFGRHHQRLRAAGLDSISFSLDGLPDTHDRIRGRKGAFLETWASLSAVVEEGRFDPCVYFTVTRENVGELVEVWRRVKALGARFDFWPVNDAEEMYLKTPEEQEAWRNAVATIAGEDREVAAREGYYREGLRYHAGEGGAVRCLGLVDQYGVTYRGDLLPCCVWGKDGLAVGNVFQTPLSTLWKTAAVQAARERLHGDGCRAGCYNHSLYEFTVSTGLSHRVEGAHRLE